MWCVLVESWLRAFDAVVVCVLFQRLVLFSVDEGMKCVHVCCECCECVVSVVSVSVCVL